MPFARALLFSVALPLANLSAIHLCAFLATGFMQGFTPGLVMQSLGIISKQLSLAWFMVIVFAAVVSFGAWLIVQRAKSTSGLSRIVLLSSAALVAALLPAGLALVVFGQPVLGFVIVVVISGLAVFFVSRDDRIADVSISTNLPPTQRMGFGQRGR